MQASDAQAGVVPAGEVSGYVRQDRIGSVVVLVLAHPPVNTLTGPVQQALLQALQAVEADPSVSAVILRGEGRVFSSGADIREAGQGARMAELSALCRKVETFSRPVIAALHGTAMGAGCELALAAHYRIANAATVLGLPEAGLGLLPGAGTTQRLPRLLGAQAALRLMLTGLPIRAPEALALGLIDRVVTENLGEAALAMAVEGLPPRPTSVLMTGLRDMVGYQAAVAAARLADQGNPLPAAGRIIDCVESAALLPFDMGLGVERAAFEDLAASPHAHGLRHAFVAERRALQVPAEVAGQGVPQLTFIGIVGASGAASDLAFDLALQALTRGLRVTLCDPDRPRLADTLSRIAAGQERAVAAGQMTEDVRDADWARVSSVRTPDGLAEVDLVLLAPDQGDVELPAGVIAAVMGALPMGVGPMGAGLTVPEASGGLAELAIGPGATVDQVLRLVALARQMNWRVVPVGPGGPVELGLRLAFEAAEEALLAQGHAPETLAAALSAFGLGATRRALPPMPRGGMALVQVCLAALAAEGARMLADGRARRPCDIDAVALLSGLMPHWLGGPMFQADLRGLLVLRADLRKLTAAVFAVPQVLDDLISEGQKFADLDRI